MGLFVEREKWEEKKKKVQGMFVKSGCFGNIWESRRKTVDMWMCLCVSLFDRLDILHLRK